MLGWFFIDRLITIIQCTRKGIYKQHMLCNTPLLKLNQLECGRHIQIHLMYTHQILWMVVITGRQWQRRGENYVLTHHFTLNRLGGYSRTSVCDNPWSQVLLWHSSTLQRVTFHNEDCSDVITAGNHRPLIFFYWFSTKKTRTRRHRKYERVQIENKTDHYLSFGKDPYL